MKNILIEIAASSSMVGNRYISPDGALTLIVDHLTEPDELLIGFEGYAWHTHADLLASLYKLPETLVFDKFLSDVMNDHFVIAVVSREDKITDVSVSFDPSAERIYLTDGKTVEFRIWSNRSPVNMN